MCAHTARASCQARRKRSSRWPTYFVIESFADLYRQTVERDFDRLYRSLPAGFTYANSAVIDVDNVLHRGTQEYHLRGGRGSGAVPV